MTARLSLPADTQHLAQLGAFVQTHCARHEQVVLIELVVTELAVNAIRHGHATTLTLKIDDAGDHYDVTLEDDGEPFNPAEAQPRPTGELRESGYGITLVHRCAQRVMYERSDGKNRTRLEFTAGGTA